jgi:hypothetical protein
MNQTDKPRPVPIWHREEPSTDPLIQLLRFIREQCERNPRIRFRGVSFSESGE